jgi:hypothetical protein
MLGSFKERLTFSNVVACIALFAALGGSAYAAATIGSAQIKNNSIQGKDIRTSTITGSDVKNNSLTALDVRESTLGKVPIASKADSATSATSASTAILAGNANTVGGKSAADLTVKCPAGTDLIAGMCIELVPRPAPANINAAAIACGTRALPTVTALIAFASAHPGQTGVEFTSDLLSGTEIAGVNVANGVLSVETNTAHQYRCAAAPGN